MKPFSLTAVLNFRKRLEDIAQGRFASAQKKEQQIREKIQTEEAFYAELIADRDYRQLQGIDINELLSLEEHIVFAKGQLQLLRKELIKRREQVELERQNLLKRSQEKQVMEKLKEKQNREWQQYLNKKEAAMLDEIAILFHDK